MGSRVTRSETLIYKKDLFKGKVILISGGGTGIGKSAANVFASLGADLIICGRDQDRIEAAALELRKIGGKVTSVSMTIRDPDSVEALMDRVWSEHGRLDVLINNAGGQFAMPALDMKPKGWLAVVDTNLNGSWYMMQAAAKRWESTRAMGNIINVVAVIWRGLPHVAHTCAARAGVIYLSKTLAVEWAPYNIRVNCLAPGTIRTDAFTYYGEAGRARFEQANPMRHAGDVDDISNGLVYLSSEASKFITGEVLNIDGGQQCWGDPWFGGRPEYFELDYSISRATENK